MSRDECLIDNLLDHIQNDEEGVPTDVPRCLFLEDTSLHFLDLIFLKRFNGQRCNLIRLNVPNLEVLLPVEHQAH